ncbi:TIGR00730 family Rossman fold protein [bacterium]|nr:TIGR00730 family Rossman fold protein [bacterium]
MKKICVYCSASDGLDESYYKEAQRLGELLGENGFDLVYGGSDFGLMGTVSKSAKLNGSKILGIMPKKIYELISHEGGSCDEFILTEDMRDRKEKLDKLSDATITLPGGFGTLEEISEIIDQKILGYTTKPIVFLNTNHFYDKLFEFFNQVVEQRFARKQTLGLFYLANTPEEAIQYIANYVPNKPPQTLDDIYVK